MEELLAYTVKIMGLRLLAVIIVSITLYSTVSAYISGSLIGMLEPPLNPEPPGGAGLLSLYSGGAIAPVTGLLEVRLLKDLLETPGVIVAWPESTVPCLFNGSPAIVRGVPEIWAKVYKLRLLSGAPFDENSYSKAWVGAELARKLGVKLGDVIVLKPLFTRVEAIFKVGGVLEVGQPYDYEVIVPLYVGYSLRGSNSPSTIRVVYNPQVTSIPELLAIISPEEEPRVELPAGLVRAATALVYKGYVRVESPEALQEYYLKRLGIPREVVFLAALTATFIVSLLNVTPALLIYTVRGKSLRVIVEQGVEPLKVKISMLTVTLPLVVAGSLTGLFLASLLDPVTIAGYPARLTIELYIVLAHVTIQATLYTIGLALGGPR